MTIPADSEVAIAKYDGTMQPIRQSIEWIKGLDRLNPGDSILIKPNIVWGGGGDVPKYGAITTTRLLEDLIILLHEKGLRKISIGEGSVHNKEINSNTKRGFQWAGLENIAGKYGIELIDFNESGNQTRIKLGRHKVKVARAPLETDFLINVPVLKTHAITKVSLGMKNLKGCLSMSARKLFHLQDLNEMIAMLNTEIKPDLTIIDGLYAMEKGPVGGRGIRSDLIISSRDVFSCDIVASTILGIDPATVKHFQKFSELTGRPIKTESIKVLGEEIDSVRMSLQWQTDIEKDFLNYFHIEGISVPWPGDCFCTNCVVCAMIVLRYFCKDNPGIKTRPVEICFGREVKAKENSHKVILIGNCANRANKDRVDAARVKGCPPGIAESFKVLVANSLEKKRARRILAARTAKAILTKIKLYKERFPGRYSYKEPEFDPVHFH